MATCKFKVGDMVIGNHPTRYGITNTGWIGKVTKVGRNTITVYGKGIGCVMNFTVDPKYFDLYEPKNKTADEKIVITHNGKTTTAKLIQKDGTCHAATANCAPEDEFDFMVGAKLALERLEEYVESKKKPITIGGFKIGDRVNYNGVNGTIICFAEGDGNNIGVEFDKKNGIYHNCGAVTLIAGTTGTKCTSRWLEAKQLTAGEVPTYWTGRVVCTEVRDCLAMDSFTVGKIYKVDNGRIIDNHGDFRPTTGDRITDPKDLTKGYYKNWYFQFIPIVE